MTSSQTQPTPTAGSAAPAFTADALLRALVPRAALLVVRDAAGRPGVAAPGPLPAGVDATAHLPPMYPEWLGDRGFGEVHGCRFPYVTGAMANGIATVELVCAAARAGCLGFFGAAGLDPARIEQAIDRLEAALDPAGLPWGSNLIHNPHEPDQEAAVADLYIRRGVRRVSAAAYMALTPALVRYAASGLRVGPAGIERRHHVFAKISHPDVARHFMQPAPAAMLDGLVARGLLSADEARLARQIPVAEDITCEADSGGHTDNRPLTALLPAVAALRDAITRERGYPRPIRVGAAGGLGTPSAIAAAFGLGAAYVLTGSVNQACVESGLAPDGRAMLAKADIGDVVMAPAADMFEMGVEVQVLKRGTFFAMRGRKLFELYRAYPSLEAIPADQRARVEKQILRADFAEAWAATRDFWQRRDPREIERAERDPKHRMALVFRAYLGQASKWAIAGRADRAADYQIWCGPAMGAFNAWVRGSFLEPAESRQVAQVALNLLEGAALITRAHQLRTFGVPMPAAAFAFRPRPLA